MRARLEVASRSSSPGIAARGKILSAVLAALAFGSLNSGALLADSASRYPIFAIKSYLGRCLATLAPATTLIIADCDNAADQAFGVEELDPDHRVRLHLAEQCVGAQAMAADAAVRLEPCSDAPAEIFALDGDSIILDANPELVVRLSNAITKLGDSGLARRTMARRRRIVGLRAASRRGREPDARISSRFPTTRASPRRSRLPGPTA